MHTMLILRETYLATLWEASLLCQVCEERPWTTRGVWHAVVLCADCAAGEPPLEDA